MIGLGNGGMIAAFFLMKMETKYPGNCPN